MSAFIYCGEGSSAKRVAKGLTLCNSDYDRNEVTKKTVTIAVAHASEAGKVTTCPVPESLKLVPHPGKL